MKTRMTRTTLSVLGAVSLAAALAACSTDTDDPADNPTTVDVEMTTEAAEEEATEAEEETTEAVDDEPEEVVGANGIATAAAGDCFNTADLGTSGVSAMPIVDCAAEHDAQVSHVFNLPDGDYPGDDEVKAQAQAGCEGAFEGFIGTPYMDSVLYTNWITPTQDTWEGAGDREVLCVVFYEDGTTATESWEGSGI